MFQALPGSRLDTQLLEAWLLQQLGHLSSQQTVVVEEEARQQQAAQAAAASAAVSAVEKALAAALQGSELERHALGDTGFESAALRLPGLAQAVADSPASDGFILGGSSPVPPEATGNTLPNIGQHKISDGVKASNAFLLGTVSCSTAPSEHTCGPASKLTHTVQAAGADQLPSGSTLHDIPDLLPAYMTPAAVAAASASAAAESVAAPAAVAAATSPLEHPGPTAIPAAEHGDHTEHGKHAGVLAYIAAMAQHAQQAAASKAIVSQQLQAISACFQELCCQVNNPEDLPLADGVLSTA